MVENHEVMKVVINTRCLNQGLTGVQRFTSELIREWLLIEEIGLVHIPYSGLLGHFLEQFFLSTLVDGVLLSPANTGPLGFDRQIIVIHDVATFDEPRWFSGSFALLYRCLTPTLCRTASVVVTVSDFSKQRIIRNLGLPKEKIVVVYNGMITGGDYVPFPNRAKTLVYLGSLEPRKNLHRLIEAWKLVVADGWQLVVVGGSSKLFADNEFPVDLPVGLKFLGRLNDGDLDKLIRSSRGLVYVSLYEGFGLPPLEAMAKGCPVLVSVCGALPEVCGLPFASDLSLEPFWRDLEEGREIPGIPYGYSPGKISRFGSAIYCNPYSVQSIAEGLIAMQKLDRVKFECLVENGRRNSGRFTWSKTVSEIRDLVRCFEFKVI